MYQLQYSNACTIKQPLRYRLIGPQFVFEMLELLLDKNMDIPELVTHHFFVCDKRAEFRNVEYYYTSNSGLALYNTKYNVLFPHDTYSTETIEKYIRRFERLKELVLSSQEELCFMYTSPSSTTAGNFLIDDKVVLHNVYFHLSKIFTLLDRFNKNFKFVVFDAVVEENKTLHHPNIILYPLTPCNTWMELPPQMEKYKHGI